MPTTRPLRSWIRRVWGRIQSEVTASTWLWSTRTTFLLTRNQVWWNRRVGTVSSPSPAPSRTGRTKGNVLMFSSGWTGTDWPRLRRRRIWRAALAVCVASIGVFTSSSPRWFSSLSSGYSALFMLSTWGPSLGTTSSSITTSRNPVATL